MRAITTRLEAKDHFTPGEIWDINRQTSFADLNVDYLLPYLTQATEQLPDSDPVAAGVKLLRDWDGQAIDDNSDGVYDGPAPAIMRTWLPILFDAVIRDDLPQDVYDSYAAKVYPAPAPRAPPRRRNSSTTRCAATSPEFRRPPTSSTAPTRSPSSDRRSARPWTHCAPCRAPTPPPGRCRSARTGSTTRTTWASLRPVATRCCPCRRT
ncbi:hypothetical protein FXW78_49555 [Rhodococcus opacus]|nr:hypothetical protein [Rhodococcus opacus]